MSCSETWRARIVRVLTEQDQDGDWAVLRAHRAVCAACRATYDAQAAAVAAWEGAPAGPTEAVRRHLEADLFAALDAEAGGADAPVLPLPAPRRHRVIVATVLALAAAAAWVVAVRPDPEPSAPAHELTARGASPRTERPTEQEGIRVLCIEDGGEAPALRSAGAPGHPAVRCARTDQLKFTVSSSALADRHLSLFSVDEGGRVHWYWPRTGTAVLPPDLRDAPLPGSFDLSVRHTAGLYTVFGVFTDDPIAREELDPSDGPALLRQLRGRSPSANILTVDLELK